MEALDLVNAALRDVGTKAIATISDATPAGAIAGDVYEIKRDTLLRSHPWNFAITRTRLAKLYNSASELVVPALEWDFAFGLPSDWMRTISVHDNDSGEDAVAYKMEAVNTSERIANGDFDSSSGWSGTNWTVSGGVATHTAGATNALTRTATLTASGLFRVTFEVSGMSTGTLQPTFSGGTGVTGTARSADGFYAEELTAHSGGNTSFNLVPSSAFDGAVDNVSVVRLDGDVAVNCIMADVDDVWLRYVRRVTDVDIMTYGFRQALIYLLGKVFAGGLVTSNTLREVSKQDLKEALSLARSIDGMEDSIDQLPVGSWVRSRGGDEWRRGSRWSSSR